VKREILGAESLGVRGLCCRVPVGERVIVIDPGAALGKHRFGLPPHPAQVANGRRVRAARLRGRCSVSGTIARKDRFAGRSRSLTRSVARAACARPR
jgi:hypothetical protein